MKKSPKKQTPADVDLMDIARLVIARLDGLWFHAFSTMCVAEIQALRDAEKRARVEAAGRVAHEAAAKVYAQVYTRVFNEAIDASR